MENLAPPLEFVLHLRFSLEKGESLKTSLKKYLQKSSSQCEWALLLAKWVAFKEIGKSTATMGTETKSIYRRALLDLLEAGFRGEPIYQMVCQVEDELVEASQSEMSRYISTLPFKSLIPLLLFQFPAFLLLLLGPLLLNFLSAA